MKPSENRLSYSPDTLLTRPVTGIVLAVLFAAFLLLQFPYLFLDLWNDELYTLKYFVFVPVSTILTDYHIPNNHILFNLLVKLWAGIWGIHRMSEAIERTWLLRLLPLIFAGGTLAYTFLIGRRLFGKVTALLALAILITTLPWMNFNLQLRGYGLSAFLLMALLHNFLIYREHRSTGNLLLVALLAMLSLYSIPLNLYFLSGLMVAAVFLAFRELVSIRPLSFGKLLRFPEFTLFISIGAGILLSLLLYLPVFRDVFFNRYVDAHGPALSKGIDTFVLVSNSLLPGRFVFLLPFLALPVLSIGYYKGRPGFFKPGHVLLPALYLLPFLFSMLRGDHAPQRAFINLAPVFALMLASWMVTMLEALRISKWSSLAFFLLVAALLPFLYSGERHDAKAQALEDIRNGNRSQDLRNGYYQHYYHPSAVVEELKLLRENDPGPVIIHDAEPHGLPEFLDAAGIPWSGVEQADSVVFATPGRVYFLTRYPGLTMRELKGLYPGRECRLLSQDTSYHNIIGLSPKIPSAANAVAPLQGAG